MNRTDLSKVHKSVLECNLSYYNAIANKLALELQVAYSKQIEIQNELSKRKENTNAGRKN